MRIAQIAPLHEAVPPRLYGGTERVVSWLTEELVALGHEVTLFASGDSETRAELVLQGRHAEAEAIFERLLALRNDVGLLAEEYDPHAGRMLGNFPQAFSHVALVNTALNLTRRAGPAEHRRAGTADVSEAAAGPA